MRGLKKMFGLALLVVSSAHAAKFETTLPSTPFPIIIDHFIMSVSGGVAWGLSGETQTLYLDPLIVRTFTSRDSTQSAAMGELFIGEQRAISPGFQGALGLAYGIKSNLNRSGDIWEQADPNFDNDTYGYSILHQHISIEGKLLSEPLRYALSPYCTASVGVGFNEVSDYHSIPTVEEESEQLPFENHSNSGFTYTLGIGIQSAFNSTWSLGVGYEFADIGKTQLGPAADQTIRRGLSQDHLYTNSAVISLTYLG